MEAVAATAAPVDEASDASAKTGDFSVFKQLFQPHVVGVYDFVLRAVRDRTIAAEVVHRTFAKAWECFPDRSIDVYSVAQEDAREALRYRERRNGAEREALDFTQVDAGRLSHRSDVSFDRELVELVWDTAAALSLEEFALLTLEVRHGVQSQNGNGLRTVRLREAFDERVTSELVVRRGRRVCGELEALVEGDGGQLARHIRECERCQARKRSFVSPSEVLRALAPIRPGSGFEAELWRGLEAAARGRRRRRFGIL